MKQAREILWAPRRIQAFGPHSWVSGVHDQEMRIRFKNGSFIKLDGSDNVDAYRGIKPKGLSVFDEFKDFKPEFYEAYDPNRAAFQSPLVIIGTPPDRECQFLDVAAEFKRDETKHFYWGPTSRNPHISREWLKAKRAEYEARGEIDVWQREYEAIYVPGGITKIFPMLTRDVVKPHNQIFDMVKYDYKKLSWYCIADPAASTVFGVLLLSINPYNKRVIVHDEIYEKEQAKMSVEQIGKAIHAIKAEWFPNRIEWLDVYDEASSWFSNEMFSRFGEGWAPTKKSVRKKEDCLSVIKDAILNKNLVISDRCTNLFKEMDNYHVDKNGKIPKADDHLIDCLRYGLDADFYSLVPEKEYIEEKDENFRGARISDDFPGLDDMGSPIDNWESYG